MYVCTGLCYFEMWGLCGLVTSSSINWLGYFPATLSSRPESVTHKYITYRSTYLFKAEHKICFGQIFQVVRNMSIVTTTYLEFYEFILF